ncbi:centriole duplication and spindle assembly protein centrobin [Arctopsyche grandis]|uniref:centriole duplication and spindle assembly protein centrobin n=1 Tax=Arctopsyche grandis TaxID=121162 RepID=UPI00406D9C5E
MSGSEGADTDALLRIPPGLFLPETTDTDTDIDVPHPATQNHVKHLSRAVQSLQDRLKHLENVSLSDSLLTPSEPFSSNNSPTKRLSNVYSTPSKTKTNSFKSFTLPKSKHRYPHSAKIHNGRFNTVQRRLNLPHLAVREKVSFSDIEILSETDSTYSADLSNMDSNNSNIVDSPDKCLDKFVLNEVDTFLSDVSRFELTGIGCTNDFKTNPNNSMGNNSFNQNKKHIDTVLSKYIYLTNSNAEKECIPNVQTVSKILNLGESKNSVPNYGAGMRDIMYPDRASKVEFDERRIEAVLMPRDNTSDGFKKLSASKVPGNNEIFESPLKKGSVINIESCAKSKSITSLPYERSTITSYGSMHDVKDSPKYKKCDIEDAAHLPNQTNSVCSEINLPSLSKMWNDSNEYKQVVDGKVNFEKFEEEKLRREHCENVIQQLQRKILEQQQKLAVAVQIDSDKDEAISKLQNARIEVSQKLYKTEDQISTMQSQLSACRICNSDLTKKIHENEEEIVKYMTLIHEYEDKLRVTIENCEIEKDTLNKEIEVYKCTIAEKEGSLADLKESSELIIRLNKQLTENMTLAQDNLEKINLENKEIKEQLVVLQKSHTFLEDELCIIKSDKTDLLTRIAEEKNRNSHLDSQKNNLQNSLDATYKKIRTLENEFANFKTSSELQKGEMKTHYQKQMETIVMEKLSEFQKQLQSAENFMTNEIQSKEKDIALQFARHLQKVEDRHQLEVNILEEKHREEIKFHKVQLNKSKQTIQLLQDKLTSYKSKRGEMAAQLHSVMENQWQEALKILTNESVNVPHIPTEAKCLLNSNGRSFDGMQHLMEIQNSNESKETQNYSRSSNKNNNQELKLTEEQLQHYIKLLLQKVPGVPDLPDTKETSEQSKTVAGKQKLSNAYSDKNLTDFEYPTSDRNIENTERKSDKYSRSKPPWK